MATNNNLRAPGEEGNIKNQRRLLLFPSCCSPHEDINRKKGHSRRRGEREQSVYVGAEACKTNGRFILLGERELILRGDGSRETEERAGYDL